MRQVVVVGGGVAGMAVAAELGALPGFAVTLVERGPRRQLPGSTGHAPGFVGLLGEAPHLTRLAQASADLYESLEHDGVRGFDRVGGMEVATTPEGMAELERRAALAGVSGLRADVLSPDEARQRAPELVDACHGAVLYARDGTARARTITAALEQRAAVAGVRFRYGTEVTGVRVSGSRVRSVDVGGAPLPADDVVIAAGIWGPQVAGLAGQQLPLVPVAHPYVHGPQRPARTTASPFVRWPEHHVYARDHGDRIGLGSYDHVPVPVHTLGRGAELDWTPLFEDVVRRAVTLLPAPLTVSTRLNGMFSMTPDNSPLLGAFEEVEGLWAAEALWVTHAGGAAAWLARRMVGESAEDEAGLAALRPDRFRGRPAEELQEHALRLYRDIYASA